MADDFFTKYRDFIKASEEHVRSQAVAKFLRDFIAELNDEPEADGDAVIKKLEGAHRRFEAKTQELLPAFLRESQKIS